MSSINYVNENLFIEDVSIEAIAGSIETPFYCYSTALMVQRYRDLQEALKLQEPTIYYAVKANPNLAVVRTFSHQGAGADVVSVGELRRCLAAGIPANKIVFAGVGKTRSEISEALKEGVFQLNVESEPELIAINEVAASLGLIANVGLRVNPDVDAKTHAKITTGLKENKFGVDLDRAPYIFENAAKSLGSISLKSLSVHIGSQLLDLAPYRTAYRKVAEMTLHLRSLGFEIDHLDLGGGLGISYNAEKAPDLNSFSEIVNDIFGDLDCRIGFEPGRYLVGDAGLLVTKVLYIKKGRDKTFIIVDGAMNDLIRPTLYEGYHDVIPVHRGGEIQTKLCDIVGPICQSGDYLAQDRILPKLNENDLLAIKSAGAYGAAMSSTYNSRPLVPEVLVNGREFCLIRRRQTVQESIDLEKIPNWLETD